MKKFHSVEDYIQEHTNFKEALEYLRSIIISTELSESIKWSAPVYDLNGKKILGLGAFKNHFGIWFFNGVFLKDEHNLLINAQENKTKALRQMRFTSIHDINKNIVLAYVKEAIENQKLGKEITTTKTTKKDIVTPAELKKELDSSAKLFDAFKGLTPSKQNEYCEYIISAKREASKQTRLKKIKPMILQGIGLNDKYRNC
ncbi:YdeI/OmpD-associated family protein [Litoribaculum gwangyangense]|uniref:YdhG-like domain-containing protein n=1 Tax=Litoribaculum gwangyangense TaxID=1130722 RepID=A0ABP9CP72_9FLAO